MSATCTCASSCPPPTHFVSDVDLAEAEGAEVGVGRLHGRLQHLVEELLHKLTDVGPHLSHRLKRGPSPGVRSLPAPLGASTNRNSWDHLTLFSHSTRSTSGKWTWKGKQDRGREVTRGRKSRILAVRHNFSGGQHAANASPGNWEGKY